MLNIQPNYSLSQNSLAFKANGKSQNNILISGPCNITNNTSKRAKKAYVELFSDFYKIRCLSVILNTNKFNYSKFDYILKGEDIIDAVAFDIPKKFATNSIKVPEETVQKILFDKVLYRFMSMSNWQCFKVLLKGLFKK